jgi:glycine oxidase
MTRPDDLLVIGAGPWGLATAWRAAQAGARVTLLDDGAPAAAWVAAGMLGHRSEAVDSEDRLSPVLAHAVDAWPGFADELARAAGRDAGYRRSGAVLAATRPEHVPVVRRRLETLARRGEPADWLTPSRLRRIEPGLGTALSGGADLPDEHQAEPRALLEALRAACAAAGVRVVPARAEALLREPRVRGARLADGRAARAGRVVLAAGWASGRLAARVPVRPVKGQILRLRSVGGAKPPIGRTVRTPSVYLAPRDGEVVVGATMEERADTHVTAGAVADLLEEARRAVPEIDEMELAEAAAGLRPTTPDGLPALGEDPDDGLVWATGGHRHGVLLTPLAARTAVDAARGLAAADWARELSPCRFARREAA